MRRLLLIPLLLVPACGTATPPAGNDASTPPASATPATCRAYATALTTNVTIVDSGNTFASTESTSCLFDPATRVLRCTTTIAGGGCTTRIGTMTYASVADFVEEAEVVGREWLGTWVIENSGSCPASTTRNAYAYDAQKRLVRSHTAGDNPVFQFDVTVAAWDALGRPTQETWTNTMGCQAGTGTRTYDDTARTVTLRRSTCSDTDEVDAVTYDADGNLVNELWRLGSSSMSRASTVNATTTLCL